jgi:outer membrane protein assembly factor BamB
MSPTDKTLNTRRLRRLFGLLLIAALARAQADAGEWPQILGPTRNGKAANEQLAESWPAGGPPILWQREVGSGYAGVAIAEGIVVLWHRIGDESIAVGLEAKSNKELWRTTYPTSYTSSIAPDNGPRCVPLNHKSRVYLVGAQGDLHCVSLKDGRKIWDRDTSQEFDVPDSYFGAGSTPIIDGDHLMMNVGARGAGIVAFSLVDGSTAWKATDDAASYSAPTTYVDDKKNRVVFATRLSTVALDPKSGEVLWRYPFGMRGPTVNAATPLVIDDHLFLSSSYGIGARWLQIAPDKVNEIWESDEVMSSQYTTCVEHEGVLYGIDGRQDQGVARLRAFDPRTRKIYWTEESFGPGNIILADGKLLILKIDGELVLAAASPQRYTQLAKAKIFESTAQPLPALSNGVLYVRDTGSLKALNVSRSR